MIAVANSILAVIGIGVLYDVVRRMDAKTCHSLRFGLAAMFCALAAEPLSWLLPGWGPWTYTILYLGLIVFIAADRRHGDGRLYQFWMWVKRRTA